MKITNKHHHALLALALIALSPSLSLAGYQLTLTSSDADPITPPNLVLVEVDEGSGVLTDDLDVDFLATPGSSVTVPGVTPDTIAAGSEVNSYFFELTRDPSGKNPPITYSLEIVFDNPILGLQFKRNTTLGNSTDAFGVLEDTTGITPTSTTGNINLPQEAITISGNVLTLDITGQVTTGFDPIRVITATPEASSLGVWTAIVGLGLAYNRRSFLM